MCVKWTSRSAKIETDSTCSRLSSVSCEVQNCTNCLFEFGRCCDMYVASSDRRHSLCDHRPVACLLAWWKNAIAWNQFSSRRVSHARSNTKPATAFIITRILQTTYTRLLFRYTLQTQSHTHTHTAEMIVKHSNETLETADWCFDVVVAVANHPPAFTRTHTHTQCIRRGEYRWQLSRFTHEKRNWNVDEDDNATASCCCCCCRRCYCMLSRTLHNVLLMPNTFNLQRILSVSIGVMWFWFLCLFLMLFSSSSSYFAGLKAVNTHLVMHTLRGKVSNELTMHSALVIWETNLKQQIE